MLKKNIGIVDRWIRLSLGIILLLLAYLWQSWLLVGFAVFTFFEALVGWCVLYQLIGKNSCPIKPKNGS